MATTYTWSFKQLDTVKTEGSLSDVVKAIHWNVVASSDNEKDANGNYLFAQNYGAAVIGEADPANFTAFNSLTKDWCKAKVLETLGKTEAQVKGDLDTRLAELITPAIAGKLPSSW